MPPEARRRTIEDEGKPYIDVVCAQEQVDEVREETEDVSDFHRGVESGVQTATGVAIKNSAAIIRIWRKHGYAQAP